MSGWACIIAEHDLLFIIPDGDIFLQDFIFRVTAADMLVLGVMPFDIVPLFIWPFIWSGIAWVGLAGIGLVCVVPIVFGDVCAITGAAAPAKTRAATIRFTRFTILSLTRDRPLRGENYFRAETIRTT